jgi:SWI/SNF-related matrix-associated actin-dependent regulator of chromatin subfamily B member 1
MREELSLVGGPKAWWEKENAVQVAPPNSKFGIMWPAEKRKVKERWRKKLGRKDLIRL